MTNTELIVSTGATLSTNIELPMPMNPFEEHILKQQEQKQLALRLAYKRIGDRLYKLFVTKQAYTELLSAYDETRIAP